MATSTKDVDVIVRGRELTFSARDVLKQVSRNARRHLRLLTEWSQISRHSNRNLFVLYHAAELIDESELDIARRPTKGTKRFLVFTEDMPAASLPYLVELNVRSRERLHLADLKRQRRQDFLRRFFETLTASGSDGVIVDAWREGDMFVVISPMFERLKVSIKDLPKLGDAPIEEVDRFEVDPYGDFVYWPSRDVHMGWSAFGQLADPHARLRAQQKSMEFNARYGRAIRALRKSMNLSQQSILGLDPRTVRRIEKGETPVSVNAIRKLAEAHGMMPTRYMSEVSEYLCQ